MWQVWQRKKVVSVCLRDAPEACLVWSADFALIIRAISVLEGVALVGDPNFAIVDEAYPFIAKLLLTDQSPRLQASLRYMVGPAVGPLRTAFTKEDPLRLCQRGRVLHATLELKPLVGMTSLPHSGACLL